MVRILLVDDDAALAGVMADMLMSGGYEVVLAASRRQVVDHINSTAFDLVVTDLWMPDLTGLDVVQLARERHGHIPVLAIGGDIESWWAEADKWPFTSYLAKPFRRAQFLAAISRLSASSRPIQQQIPPPGGLDQPGG